MGERPENFEKKFEDRTLKHLRRKNSKHLVEKKRRERINKCLNELKKIVLANSAEELLLNKLEKAQILEMTLNHIYTLQKNTVSNRIETDGDYRCGYLSCINKVVSFLSSSGNTAPDFTNGLVENITGHITVNKRDNEMTKRQGDGDTRGNDNGTTKGQGDGFTNGYDQVNNMVKDRNKEHCSSKSNWYPPSGSRNSSIGIGLNDRQENHIRFNCEGPESKQCEGISGNRFVFAQFDNHTRQTSRLQGGENVMIVYVIPTDLKTEHIGYCDNIQNKSQDNLITAEQHEATRNKFSTHSNCKLSDIEIKSRTINNRNQCSSVWRPW